MEDTSQQPPTFEALVGQRIADLRERKGLSQRELGELVQEFLERKLHRQSISVMEQGGRGPTGAELLAIAEVLGTTVGHLLLPSADVKEIKVPSGATRTREEIDRLIRDPEVRNVVPATAEAIARVGNWLNEMLAGGTIELRELRDAYAAIALGASPIPDQSIGERTNYVAEETTQAWRSENAKVWRSKRKEANDGQPNDQAR